MKKLLFLIIIVGILLVSCYQSPNSLEREEEQEQSPPDYSSGFDMVFDIPHPEDPFPPPPALSTTSVEDIMLWIAAPEIQYVNDLIHDVDEYWQNPYQTYTWRCGDCEDYSILAMYLIYRRDIEPKIIPEMVVGYMYKDGEQSGLHAWVHAGGEDWEPQAGMTIDEVYTEYDVIYTALYIVPYEEAIYRSAITHKALRMKEK